LRKTKKAKVTIAYLLGQDSNQGPLEYEAGFLITISSVGGLWWRINWDCSSGLGSNTYTPDSVYFVLMSSYWYACQHTSRA